MGKCHNMLIACTTVELKYLEEEYQRQQEAQHPFYLEHNQEEYIRRWEAANRDYDAEIDNILNAQPGHDTILTGDAALDDEEEAQLSFIDFSEEINLNDLYD